MNITKEQLEKLKNLNDSRVDDILGIQTLEVGNWYKDKECKGFYYINAIQEDRIFFDGFNDEGLWTTDDWCLTSNCELIRATIQEVEEALIDEAKRRGFKEGVRVYRFWRWLSMFLIRNNNFELKGNNTLLLDGVEIFENGYWAEVIDEKTELRQEIKELEIRLKELRKKL